MEIQRPSRRETCRTRATALEVLEGAYTSKSGRECLAAATGNDLDMYSEDDNEEDDNERDDDADDDDDNADEGDGYSE